MSMINRYKFVKNLYPEYLVIIIRKRKYYSFYRDLDILKYINFKDNTRIIKNKKINYIVINNMDIVEKYSYKDNNYDKYLIIILITY